MYIKAEGNYSEVFIKGGKKQKVSFQLGKLVIMIEEQLGEDESPFIRIGKSLIVNRDFVYQINISEQELVVSDWLGNYDTLFASRKALCELKAILENTNV